MCHFTDVGRRSGTIRWRDGHAVIGGLPARDDHRPIGMALAFGIDDQRRSLRRPAVHGAAVAGVFIVEDRKFDPVK